VQSAIKAWMSGDPLWIEPEACALEALERMQERGIRHLPVLDAERRVVGVLSLDDLRAALPFPVSLRSRPSCEQRESGREWTVAEVMTHAPETLPEGADLSEAAERMAERRIGCLPIVDAERRLAGILTETDLLHALATLLWAGRVRGGRPRRGDELSQLVAELRREREALAARLDRYHALERELATHPGREPLDLSEAGADQTELQLTERLDALAARRLAALDHALDRAARGALGVCERCGGRIPPARLRALPGAALCVACARAAAGGPAGG
jgi:CBS domain-containing protein/RNA polymerase-binding transcription factor DksA